MVGSLGYNEGGEFNMADYAFNGRKLRPLMPRPVTSPNNNSATTTPNCLSRIHGNDFFSQYHNLGMLFLPFFSPVCFQCALMYETWELYIKSFLWQSKARES